jgi:hypothetical protein
MAVLALKSFGGIAPIVSPRYLKDTQAQTALNCPVFQGSLEPLSALGTAVTTLPKTGTILTAYRFGQNATNETDYWFHWTTDVDVARGQIAGDTSEWTFFTGDGAPKATYNSLALSGTAQEYPTASRPLGLPAPASAPTVAATGTAASGALTETRVYTTTFVNKESGFEFESAPSAASSSVDVQTGQSVTVSNLPSVPGGDYVVSHRRIYRSVSGTFLFVAEVAASATSYTDSVDADSCRHRQTLKGLSIYQTVLWLVLLGGTFISATPTTLMLGPCSTCKRLITQLWV